MKITMMTAVIFLNLGSSAFVYADQADDVAGKAVSCTAQGREDEFTVSINAARSEIKVDGHSFSRNGHPLIMHSDDIWTSYTGYGATSDITTGGKPTILSFDDRGNTLTWGGNVYRLENCSAR